MPVSDASPEADWEIRILYDAECPLCLREGNLLRRLDNGRGRLQLEDLSAPEFDPSVYGLTQAEVEGRIHAVLPDGQVVEGVDVFVRAYSAVGLAWLAAPANWRIFRWILDRAYLWFARNRLRITGRAPATCAVEPNGSVEPACGAKPAARSRPA